MVKKKIKLTFIVTGNPVFYVLIALNVRIIFSIVANRFIEY